MFDIKSELGTKLPPKANTGKAPRVQQADQTENIAENTVEKTAVIIILSAEALKISREQQAIKNNPDLEPKARADASDKLRQLALKVYSDA